MAPGENLLFFVAFIGYILALALYWVDLFRKKKGLDRAALAVVWGAVLAHAVALVVRTVATRWPPMTNLYESLSFFAWTSAIAYLVAYYWTRLPILGCLTLPVCVGLMGMGSAYRPDQIRPIMPALRSSFLLPTHVAIAFIGEACFAVGFAAALLYLLKVAHQRLEDGKINSTARAALSLGLVVSVWLLLAGVLFLGKGVVSWAEPSLAKTLAAKSASFGIWGVAFLLAIALSPVLACPARRLLKTLAEATPELEVMDRISYTYIAVGYPLFLLGALVLGMLWAHQAWGRYWGWDPKETWALITFIVYSIYIHARYTSGWKGTWAAIFAVAGFVATIFTFVGVNLLLSGLHSYASS